MTEPPVTVPDAWQPAALPADPAAAEQLREWLAAEKYNLNGTGRDFRGADLSGGDFSNYWFTDAVLVGVRLVGASSGTRFIGAELLDTDMRGSDLSDAVVEENYFGIKVDDTTVLRGLRGTGFGPVTVVSDGSSREVGGAELEAWISARGGQVQVIPPRRPAGGTP